MPFTAAARTVEATSISQEGGQEVPWPWADMSLKYLHSLKCDAKTRCEDKDAVNGDITTLFDEPVRNA